MKNKFTKQEVIEALVKNQGFVYLTAKHLKCHVNTVLNYKKKYKEIQDVREQLKGEMVDYAEGKLLKAIQNGEAWAICFFLKTQGKDRGYVESSNLDAAIRIQCIEGVNDQEILGTTSKPSNKNPAAPAS